MAVDGVTSMGASVKAGSSSMGSTDSAMGMSTDDFYRLLVAEMRYQDPMQPMDNSKMVEQVAGIRSIEASTTMTSTLQTVTNQQNYATAASLMGKYVTGTVQDVAGNNVQVGGVVTRVTFESNGNVVLELDGTTRIPLSAVTDVQNAPATPPASQQALAQASYAAAPQQKQGLLHNLVPGQKAA